MILVVLLSISGCLPLIFGAIHDPPEILVTCVINLPLCNKSFFVPSLSLCMFSKSLENLLFVSKKITNIFLMSQSAIVLQRMDGLKPEQLMSTIEFYDFTSSQHCLDSFWRQTNIRICSDVIGPLDFA